jgi:hypothetical protein
MPINDSEQLILEMRECASLLQKFASDESLAVEKTASASAPVSTSRSEYMDGLMQGMGLEG